MNMETLAAFFGWCSVLNIGLLFISTVAIILMRNKIAGIHARMFELDASDVRMAYFEYLARYKIAVLVFNIVPYIALKLVG